MIDIDWSTPPKDDADFSARQEALVDCDVLSLLEVDPRDEVFGDLLYYHPNPTPVCRQVDGGVGVQAVLAQLIISDMIDAGLIDRMETGALQITEAGLVFANSRLSGPDGNSIYLVRDDAPSYGPLSAASAIALKHLILHTSPYVKYLLQKGAYHPVLGSAVFD